MLTNQEFLSQIQKNISLIHYHTLHTNVYTKYLIEINNINQINFLLDYLNKTDVNFIIIGSGSNILFKNDFNGIVIVIKLKGKSLIKSDDCYGCHTKIGVVADKSSRYRCF